MSLGSCGSASVAPPRWTGVSQYGHTCHCCSSGLRQRRHDDFSRFVQCGQQRGSSPRSAAGRTGRRDRPPVAAPWRGSQLALAHVLEVLGRPQDRVHEGTDEREDQGRDDCDRDEDRVSDPPLRVLVRPEREREPHDDDEEPGELQEGGERPRREEVSNAVERVVGCRREKDHGACSFDARSTIPTEDELADHVAHPEEQHDRRRWS